jgi:hypothetical protein
MRFEPTQNPKSHLPRLLREDAPLQSGNTLVLMFDSTQVEMPNGSRLGIRSWIASQLTLYGLPSLVRFGRRDRPSVFRRDEFVLWMHSAEQTSVANL